MSSDSLEVQEAPAQTERRPDPTSPSSDARALLRGNYGPIKGLSKRLFIALGVCATAFIIGFVVITFVLPFFWPSGSSQTATAVAAVDTDKYRVRPSADPGAEPNSQYRIHSSTVLEPTSRTVHAPADAANAPTGAQLPRSGAGEPPTNPFDYTTAPSAHFTMPNVPGLPQGSGLLQRAARLEVANADSGATSTTNASSAAQDSPAPASPQGDSQPSQVVQQPATPPPTDNGIAGKRDSVYLNESVQAPRTPCVLQQGGFMPTIYAGAVSTDFPGDPILDVTGNVFSSDQTCLMVPKNSQIRCKYLNVTENGQRRVFMVATRLIFPNRSWITLNNFDVQSQDGSAGVNAWTKSHTWGLIGQTLLLSGFEAVFNRFGTPAVSQIQIGGPSGMGGGQSGLNDLITKLVDSGTSQTPQLNIDVGTRVNVEVMYDMELTGPYQGRSL